MLVETHHPAVWFEPNGNNPKKQWTETRNQKKEKKTNKTVIPNILILSPKIWHPSRLLEMLSLRLSLTTTHISELRKEQEKANREIPVWLAAR